MIFWICTGFYFLKSIFGLSSEQLDTLHGKLFKGTDFSNKIKREEIEARKKRWVFSDGVGTYVTEPTLFIFLRGSLIPKLCHLQKNLWIKIYVTLSPLSLLIQHLLFSHCRRRKGSSKKLQLLSRVSYKNHSKWKRVAYLFSDVKSLKC